MSTFCQQKVSDSGLEQRQLGDVKMQIEKIIATNECLCLYCSYFNNEQADVFCCQAAYLLYIWSWHRAVHTDVTYKEECEQNVQNDHIWGKKSAAVQIITQWFTTGKLLMLSGYSGLFHLRLWAPLTYNIFNLWPSVLKVNMNTEAGSDVVKNVLCSCPSSSKFLMRRKNTLLVCDLCAPLLMMTMT